MRTEHSTSKPFPLGFTSLEIRDAYRNTFVVASPLLKKKSLTGFTLLEMLLSIALLSSLAAVVIPVSQSFQNRNDLDVTAMSVAQSVRRAAALSQAVDGDSTWGVRVQSGSVTIFRGASYATRVMAFDELLSLPTSVSISGTTEYVFAKLTGLPTTTGALTLTSLNNETRTVTVNAKGMVNY